MVEAPEWLIRKDGYYYRPNCAGYTTSKFEAGRYTKAEAEREAAVEPWHMKAIHEDDVEDDPVSSRVRMDSAHIAELEAENERLRLELHKRLAVDIDAALSRTAAPEGQQPVAKHHPLEAYADSYAQMSRMGDGRVDCRSVEVDIRQNMIPATRPSEQAVTEAMVEAAAKAFFINSYPGGRNPWPWVDADVWGKEGKDERHLWENASRAALKAAMEAGR